MCTSTGDTRVRRFERSYSYDCVHCRAELEDGSSYSWFATPFHLFYQCPVQDRFLLCRVCLFASRYIDRRYFGRDMTFACVVQLGGDKLRVSLPEAGCPLLRLVATGRAATM